MTRIFLSYAREDSAKAGGIAKTLEQAGHQVWWDHNIGGGARFGQEIASALTQAEAVIVLWSLHSVDSSWVLDEAAEGRDSGRLIPLLIDGTRPPLGFRQVQGIDLSRWKGRGRLPNLAAIEAAIGTVKSGGTLAHPLAPEPRRVSRFGGWKARAAVAFALAMLIIGIAYYAFRQSGAVENRTTLAVLPFADLSADQDKAYFSEGISEEIRTLLSEEPRLRIIGRSSTEMLGKDADLGEIRKRLGVSHLLEGSVRIDRSKLRIYVRLVNARNGLRVWAEQFDRDLNDVFAVQDEIASEVVSRIRGGLVTPTARLRPSRRTSMEVFDLYLGAMSKINRQEYQAALEARQMLLRAVERDPRYAPAWVGLIHAGIGIDQQNPAGQNLTPADERSRWLLYAKRAIRLDPQLPEAHTMLARLQSERFEGPGGRPEILLAGARRAIALDPSSYRGWHEAARALDHLCRRKESLSAWTHARSLEPLLEYPAFNQVQLLSDAGRADDAEAVWYEFRDRSRKPYPILGLIVEGDRIDSSKAVINGLAAKAADPSDPLVNTWLAVQLQALGYSDRAFQLLPEDHRRTIGAYWRGQYALVASRSPQLKSVGSWPQRRTAAILRSLARLGRHQEIVSLVEQRFGSIATYARGACGVPFQAGTIAVALRRLGRRPEADELLAAAQAGWAAERRFGPLSPPMHVAYAEVLLLSSNELAALSELEYASAHGWTGHFAPFVDLQDPIFDPLRHRPRFKAIERQIAQTQARESRELAAAERG